MSLDNMVYKNYKWKHNPRKIQITDQRNIKEHVIPFCGNIFQDYGRKKRVVKGSGEFFGNDALEQFNELYKVFEEGGLAYLKIPKITPFLAYFVSFNLVGETSDQLIKYEFEFWEQIKPVKSGTSLNYTYHTVKQGETLWDIAATYSVSLASIINVNPQIKRPDELVAGQKVILP